MNIREAAALGLGTLHDLGSLPLLEQIASNPDEGPDLRATMIASLGELGVYLKHNKQSIERITTFLLPILTQPAKHPESVVVRALHTFGKTADPRQAEILFPLLTKRDWNASTLEAIQTIVLEDPQGCATAVQAYLKWRVTTPELHPGVVRLSPDLIFLGLTVPPAPSYPLPTIEAAVKTIVQALVEAHREDQADVRRLASHMLEKLFQDPNAPRIFADADKKMRISQIQEWNQWWRENSSKLYLFQGILICRTEGH
jgi:hypothetical protein